MGQKAKFFYFPFVDQTLQLAFVRQQTKMQKILCFRCQRNNLPLVPVPLKNMAGGNTDRKSENSSLNECATEQAIETVIYRN